MNENDKTSTNAIYRAALLLSNGNRCQAAWIVSIFVCTISAGILGAIGTNFTIGLCIAFSVLSVVSIVATLVCGESQI